MVDPIRLTITYLRLWKICDSELANGKKDSARPFEVIPMDEVKLVKDLRSVSQSDLAWAEDPKELRDDIFDVLKLVNGSATDEKRLATIAALRGKFQTKALQYSGNIQIATGSTGAGF